MIDRRRNDRTIGLEFVGIPKLDQPQTPGTHRQFLLKGRRKAAVGQTRRRLADNPVTRPVGITLEADRIARLTCRIPYMTYNTELPVAMIAVCLVMTLR